MSDLQVSLALALENDAELIRELQKAGGQAGDEFAKGLSATAQKAFDGLATQAEKAAKEVGLRFNRTKLQFEMVSGELVPQKALDQLAKVNKGFGEAKRALDVFRAAIVDTGRETEGAAKKFDLLEAAITGVAVSLTSKLTDAVGSALGSVKGLVSGFLELDGELRLAAAAAGEQGGYERLGRIVDQVGIDAAGTTKQVAELATSLVRAGFTISEVEGALGGVVRGAEATGTGFESFGNIVGNTLRGFGLEVDQTARVVDVLVNAANSSNASIEGLGYTFEYTAPIAKALGVSLEDVAAAAGLMANAGIQGSVAGTGLRTGLQKLQQAAGGASPEVLGLVRGQERLTKVMAQLGTTVTDSKGKLLPLEQVFLRLRAGLEKLNQADQVQLANVLFGDEAGSKFLAITNQSSAAISKMFGDMRNSTGAANTARGAMAGMGLELQQLTGTMDSLSNNTGKVLAAGLRPLVQVANAAVGAIAAMPGPLKDTAGALFALGVTATGATVAMTALNVVAAQVGGWVAIKDAANTARLAVGGFGGSLAIVVGLVVGVAALAGAFGEMDRTTKALVQTMGAVATGILIFRTVGPAMALASAALAYFNIQLARTGVLAGLVSGAVKGGPVGALIGLIVAAGGAALAYKVIGDNVKVAGEETDAMAEKVRNLKDEIAKLQNDITQGKKLGIDTTDAERQVEILQLRLQEIEAPLSLKLDIEKAKGKVKELKEQYDKLGDNDNRKAPFKAQLEAAKQYQEFLQQIDQGKGVQGSPIVRQLGKDVVKIQERVKELMQQKLVLPITAKAERKRIDSDIDTYQQQLNLRKVRASIELNSESAKAQFNALMGDIAVAQSKGLNTTKMEADLLPIRNRLRLTDLERAQNEKDLAKTLDRTAEKEKERVRTAKEQIQAGLAKLEVEQAAAALADRAAGLDSARLRTVQQVADAYSNLASAQAGLMASNFDIERSRNGQRLSVAERELAFLQQRGAGAQVIRAAEEQIAQIKRDGEAIEFRAMESGIRAAAQRFEIERRVLDLKQASQLLEQQGAIRAADQGVLAQRQRLLELRSKALEPGTTPEQKASLQEQARIQGQAVTLSQQQAAAERERLQSLGLIFGLEKQAQEAQQQTVANQQRAGAASKGWELGLTAVLGVLDRAAGITAANEAKVRGTTQTYKELVGFVQAASGKPENIYAETQKAVDATANLAEGYRLANQQAQSLLATVQQLAKAPAARWAGGGVEAGGQYQVNELGTESFLSSSGMLSLIHAPAYGSWSPPSAGMVLPAGLTARLDAMGAFDGGGRAAPVMAALAPSGGGSSGPQLAALARLEGSINRLERTMGSYRPEVTVNLPANAGLLHTLQSFR